MFCRLPYFLLIGGRIIFLFPFMRRILIVDNDRDMCGIISEILRDENNEVNIAHDGNTALGRIKKKLMTC